MRAASICLVPRGDTPTSARLFQALLSHCVPLILSPHIRPSLPFSTHLDYDSFSFFLSPLSLSSVDSLLREISIILRERERVEEKRSRLPSAARIIDYFAAGREREREGEGERERERERERRGIPPIVDVLLDEMVRVRERRPDCVLRSKETEREGDRETDRERETERETETDLVPLHSSLGRLLRHLRRHLTSPVELPHCQAVCNVTTVRVRERERERERERDRGGEREREREREREVESGR
jgi:hypothetical protein